MVHRLCGIQLGTYHKSHLEPGREVVSLPDLHRFVKGVFQLSVTLSHWVSQSLAGTQKLTVYAVSLCRWHSGERPSVQAHAQCLLQLSAPRGKGAVKQLLRSTSVVAAIRWWVKWFLYIHTGVKSTIENEHISEQKWPCGNCHSKTEYTLSHERPTQMMPIHLKAEC